jgi:hypothetical protein
MKEVNRIKTRISLSKGKIIAVFLAMTMAVSFLPATYAFAETPEDETSVETPLTTEITLTLAEIPQDESAPVPTAPGNSLVANEDGTYIELDENGISILQWTWDTEVGEWKSEPVTQWSWTVEDVAWEFEQSDVPLTEWTFTDTVEWEFEDEAVPLEDWNFGTATEEWDFTEIPKTDDSTDLFLRAALFGTSTLGLAALILTLKKSVGIIKSRSIMNNK